MDCTLIAENRNQRQAPQLGFIRAAPRVLVLCAQNLGFTPAICGVAP